MISMVEYANEQERPTLEMRVAALEERLRMLEPRIDSSEQEGLIVGNEEERPTLEMRVAALEDRLYPSPPLNSLKDVADFIFRRRCHRGYDYPSEVQAFLALLPNEYLETRHC
jgi:BMFP domain-containing protein YqiC